MQFNLSVSFKINAQNDSIVECSVSPSEITKPHFNGMVDFSKHQGAVPEERGNGGSVRGVRHIM